MMTEAIAISPGEVKQSIQTRPAGGVLSPEAVRAQLERILNSKAFARSPRISRFLTFVVGETLEGQESKLKEYLLGVEVFGRQDSFDPRIDSIVRVEARRLRYKLEKYYETEGRNDTLHIQFRKGCYVPSFAERRPGDPAFGSGELSDVPYVSAIQNPHAFSLYARGRNSLGRWSTDGIAEAVSCFTQAVDEDPGCASAHAGLASAWMLASLLGLMPARDVVPKAKNSAARALSSAPQCSEAHAVLGIAAALYDWEWAEAETKLRAAIHANPCDAAARVWYGLYLTLTNRPEDAVRELRRAQQALPTSLTTHLATGFACHAGQAYDEALMQYRLAQDLDPSFYGTSVAMGLLFADQQMFEQALHVLSKASASHPRHPALMSTTAYAHAAAGHLDVARTAAGELFQLAERQWVSPVMQAMVHASLGDVDSAFFKLDRAVTERAPWLATVGFLRAFDPVRRDERYPALLQQIGRA
jgi:tetratricopeptide (TPR) repeat protein